MDEGVCSLKQMATEQKRAEKRNSCKFCVREFILYVSPNWGPWQSVISLIHTWQQIRFATLFRCSLSVPLGIENPQLRMFLFAYVTVHEPSLCVNTRRA